MYTFKKKQNQEIGNGREKKEEKNIHREF